MDQFFHYFIDYKKYTLWNAVSVPLLHTGLPSHQHRAGHTHNLSISPAHLRKLNYQPPTINGRGTTEAVQFRTNIKSVWWSENIAPNASEVSPYNVQENVWRLPQVGDSYQPHTPFYLRGKEGGGRKSFWFMAKKRYSCNAVQYR